MDKRESTVDLNGTLVNVLTGRLEENTDIIVCGNTIALVGDASSHPVGEDTEVIDATGRYMRAYFPTAPQPSARTTMKSQMSSA